MKSNLGSQKARRVSDEAVKAKTGKVWQEWFAILDAAGAREMSHTEIARHLQQREGAPHWWWCQMVANTYEQDRGLREKHQMPQGFQISVSKTIAAPVAALYRSWNDASLRMRWLPDAPLAIRKATQDKSLRMTWSDGSSAVEVLFNAKGDAKYQVVVQHSKLADADQAEAMKSYWSKAL
ncbi:MAG: hypothetical protein EXR53_05890 [Dehalococcoidia bacterium]|nr:hypothetical protein [Dehalococcoidia bacterium]